MFFLPWRVDDRQAICYFSCVPNTCTRQLGKTIEETPTYLAKRSKNDLWIWQDLMKFFWVILQACENDAISEMLTLFLPRPILFSSAFHQEITHVDQWLLDSLCLGGDFRTRMDGVEASSSCATIRRIRHFEGFYWILDKGNMDPKLVKKGFSTLSQIWLMSSQDEFISKIHWSTWFIMIDFWMAAHSGFEHWQLFLYI